MDKWISRGLYQHPTLHLKGVFGKCGHVCLSDDVTYRDVTKRRGPDKYYVLIEGCRMSCPQPWASRIHVEENISILREVFEAGGTPFEVVKMENRP
ncbi:MAG: hypothetical protein MUO24_02350 [Desulfobacterales bacterium]|nr:hypothetical protein [Desulfobacterales bacterium]